MVITTIPRLVQLHADAVVVNNDCFVVSWFGCVISPLCGDRAPSRKGRKIVVAAQKNDRLSLGER